MKKAYGTILSFFLLVMGAADVQAAETTTLGNFNFAVKIDSLNFIADDIKESGADTATYVGLEAYASVAPNLYLGGEIGHANSKGSFPSIEFGMIHNELTFVPVEVNLKYAVEATRHVSFDFGGGLSCNHVDYVAKTRNPFFMSPPPVGESTLQHVSTWLPGVQVFADVNVTLGPVFVGLNAKFQPVSSDEAESSSGVLTYTDYTNWRVGGQIGVRF